MNVACPECGTIYRVDPSKVPARGVRARCVRCPGEFQVEREEGTRQGAATASLAQSGVLEAVAAPAPYEAPTRDPDFPSGEEGATGLGADLEDIGTAPLGEDPTEAVLEGTVAPGVPSFPPSSASMGSELAASPSVSEPIEVRGEEPPLPPPPFGSADPKVRARRLARALVSDMVVYNSERRARSLQNGTLRQEFRDEIRKSWEEYVSQVGNEIARETSYFQEALNEILAGGVRQF